MKKSILLLTVMAFGAFALMSFTVNNKTKVNSIHMTDQSSDCVRIYVKWSSGSKATSGSVSGDVNYGGITDKFYLNSSGYADICYSSNNRLNAVFIDGKKYSGKYYKGHSYTIYKR